MKRALGICLNNIVHMVRTLHFSSMFVRLLSICNIDVVVVFSMREHV